MATRPRRRTTARRGSRKLPPWALVLAGLTVGLAVAWGIHLYLVRTDARNAPVRATVAQTPAPKPEASAKPAQQVKPKFDFYTILPEIETVVPEKERKARAAKAAQTGETSRYMLQAGSFASFDDADRLKAKLALSGLEAHIEKITIEGKGEYYRVRLGPYKRLEDTDPPSRQLSELGIKAMLLKLKKAPGA